MSYGSIVRRASTQGWEYIGCAHVFRMGGGGGSALNSGRAKPEKREKLRLKSEKPGAAQTRSSLLVWLPGKGRQAFFRGWEEGQMITSQLYLRVK